MKFQDVALAVLLVMVGALMTLLLTQEEKVNPLGSTAYGQVAGFNQDFIAVTGDIANGYQALYIFDTKRLTLIAVWYDWSSKTLQPLGRMPLADAFRSQ
jgi:hypothetical protein